MAKVIVDLGVAGLTIGDILWVGCERVRDYVVVPTLDSTLTYIPDSVGSYWLENPNVTENSLFYICKNLTTITPVGQSWAQQVNPKNINLSSVCWSGTQFVAVGDHDSGDAYILTSPDGITWTERVNPINIQLNSVCWADTQFVAVGLASGVYAYIVASKTNTVITQIFPGVYGLFISSDFGLSMCNSAILTLGGNNIGSFDDATVEAVLCKSLWSQALDSLLRLHPWNCAITRAALLPDAVAPAYEWTSAFTLPTDLLRLLEVYGVTEYKVEGRKILCNEATLNIRYVFRNEDTSEWDSLLTEAMTAYMAFKLAYPLTKSNTTKDSQWQLFTNLLRTAKSIDTQEEPGDTVGDFPFIEVRRR